MSSERELKIAVGDPAALRRRLQGLGARLLHAEGFEDNLVWDRGGELRAAGCLLRLREDGRGARLTFKGPASFEDGVKVRAEHETAIGDPASAAAILRALGYEQVRRYQKYREEWRLAEVTVALDRTPIGDFAEFEGGGAAAVAARCGCPPSTALAADYLALYEAFRQRHPDAPEDMVFARREGGDG
ncbi:MAG: class IV adenylate cyclase [Acidobacteriota bacterium]|nr:class IV adenylate cyclase [Acidobacteriota bacterium]MDH3522274.1 class IV adenylate cyclase [Acidobacteriota bacterium]